MQFDLSPLFSCSTAGVHLPGSIPSAVGYFAPAD